VYEDFYFNNITTLCYVIPIFPISITLPFPSIMQILYNNHTPILRLPRIIQMQLHMTLLTVIPMLPILHLIIEDHQGRKLHITGLALPPFQALFVDVHGVGLGVEEVEVWVEQAEVGEDEHVVAALEVAVDVGAAEFDAEVFYEGFLHWEGDVAVIVAGLGFGDYGLGDVDPAVSQVVVEYVVDEDERGV
jgi:hypothetical protein